MLKDNAVINVSDLVEENGKTVRENNLAKNHNIAIGELVENVHSGTRLYVFGYGRDCDGTPLYHLTANRDIIGEEINQGIPDLKKEHIEIWLDGITYGKVLWNYTSEDNLRVVNYLV
ncbi:hypothetical protein LZK84_16415 [Pseudomonas aeruginosa]|nr:hypothetical protein [Pseudomonas aeruginosa]